MNNGSLENKVFTIGLLSSTASTLDSFFVEMVENWSSIGVRIVTAAGTSSKIQVFQHSILDGLTREPNWRNVAGLRQLREWVREERVDLVLTNTATSSTLVRVARVGVPIVYFCHGLHWNESSMRNLPMRIVEKVLSYKTDGVICMNAADKQWFTRSAPRLPLMCLDFGVGLEVGRFVRQEQLLWKPGSLLKLVWCGEYSPRKDPIAVVMLARELEARGVDFQIDMLGEGELFAHPDMQDSVGGRIKRHGKADPVPFFQQAHALFQTSHWEGLPRVALEAVAMGRPTVGFDVKGVSDVRGVYLAADRTAHSLADAVLEASTCGARDLPPVAVLRFDHCADEVLGFVEMIRSKGDFGSSP